MKTKIAEIVLPQGYHPSEDEEYMSLQQKAFFRQLLLDWRQQLVSESERIVAIMNEEQTVFADPTDRATLETDRNFELRARDRERKLIGKIDRTLEILETDDYGYCMTCGVEIGLRRLEARPVTDLCIDCKTKEEHLEKARRPPAEDESEF
ncbi:MAG: RNA polymerase-binding protein DksA [Magnetococcales bacterium]|nr:RNA polymerase-binding protein DksA [Magnetococcales bacterium]